MSVTVEQLDRWLLGQEDEHLEFKRAERSYPFDDVASIA
jgi:hypothetical protein